jgi:hypothetical protein
MLRVAAGISLLICHDQDKSKPPKQVCREYEQHHFFVRRRAAEVVRRELRGR